VGDFDLDARAVTIRRANTYSELREPKNGPSWSVLPIEETLLDLIRTVTVEKTRWLFPSPVTCECMSADTILSKKIKPLATKPGLPKMDGAL